MKLKDLEKIKILFIDIETAPNIGYFWKSGYEIDISHDSIIQERQVIMVSWNWLHEDEDSVKRLDWGLKKRSDKRLLEKFAKVLNSADIVIGHNGDNFDLKWLKTRTLMQGLPPLDKVVSIDTLKLARSHFNFNSNKLDYLSTVFNEGSKLPTSYSLWKKVMKGDKEALDTMGVYCDNDVILLRRVFIKMLPYIDKLGINMSLYNKIRDDNICNKCAMSNTMQKNGYRYTTTNKYQALKCKNCHGQQRSVKPIKE